MEGLHNGSNGTYLGIVKGKFRIKVQDGTENSVQETNTKGNVNSYLYFNQLTGTVTGFSTRERTDLKGETYLELLITVTAGTTKYIVPVSTKSGYYRALCNQIFSETFDLSKPLTFSPTYSDDGTNKSSGMFVNQNGEGVKPFMYTKDNPLDAPQMKAVLDGKGKHLAWDTSERDTYFLDKFNALNGSLTSHTAAALINTPFDNGDADPENSGDVDDLPF
jgi:hypothetical protein